ncbi:MAG: hypothetical protein H7837_09205 [Magnetococcus sp. MYC-9]
MAESDGGIFGFFKKKGPEVSSTPAASAVRESRLDVVSQMVPLLIAVHEAKAQVEVSFGNASFFSLFEWELLDGGDGKVVQGKTHLEEARCLLLAPMEPPIGNLKIRSAGEIRLEFASRTHLLVCVTTLLQITPARRICLAFPKSLQQKPERRAVVRILVDRTLNVVLTVVRPSGIAFEAKFRTISAKGAAFYGTGAIPKIADGSELEMTIAYPEGTVEVEAVVLGSYSKDGEQLFRIQFSVPDQQVARAIGALASFVQRSNLQRRTSLLR